MNKPELPRPAMPDTSDPVIAAAQAAVRRMRGRLSTLPDDGLDLLFREARSHAAWLDRPVSDDDLRAIYEVTKFGPTSTNGNPGRFVFVRNKADKERLAACAAPANGQKIMNAPVTAIIAHDTEFWRHMPTLFGHNPGKMEDYRTKPEYAEVTAFRNSTLQGAYFMVAVRALGFDVGPLSGFDNAKVDAAFFADGNLRSNFLCNIGHADERAMFQRLPRLDFDEVCTIL